VSSVVASTKQSDKELLCKAQQRWPVVHFNDVLKIVNGKNQRQVEDQNGRYPIYGSGGIMGYANDYLCRENTVVVGRKGTINRPLYVTEKFWNVDTAFGLVARTDTLLPKYLYYFCTHFDFMALNTTVTIPSLTKANLLKIEMPLPPLPIQQEIANTLDQVTALIEKRKTQIQKLDQLIKSRFIEMFGDPMCEDISSKYDMHPLIELCAAFVGGGTPAMSHPEYYEEGDIPWVKSGDVKSMNVSRGVLNITKAGLENSTASMLPAGAVIVVTRSGILKHTLPVAITMNPLAINQDLKGIVVSEHVSPEYLLWAIKMNEGRLLSQVRAVTADNIETGFLKKIPIIVPPIDLQNRFADFVRQADKSKLELQQGLEQLSQTYKSLMQEYFC
jgi:type I restriction enzyme S subunit